MSTTVKTQHTQDPNLQKYSLSTRVIHWLTALLVLILFPLGYWMSGLNYYHAWYQTAPMLHVGTGLILMLVLLARIANRLLTRPPAPLASHTSMERTLATSVHMLLYLLLTIMVVTGYLLAGIEGQGVSFYGLFALPGMQFDSSNVEDLLEKVHEFCAYGLVAVALLHAGAALKHHFIDRDQTVRRMLR